MVRVRVHLAATVVLGVLSKFSKHRPLLPTPTPPFAYCSAALNRYEKANSSNNYKHTANWQLRVLRGMSGGGGWEGRGTDRAANVARVGLMK